MKMQLWRNATIELEIGEAVFLIDPMLGEKGSFGPFPWTDDQRSNPLVDLPFSQEELLHKLEKIDTVFITHLHPDHLDPTAIELIDKDKPIICPDAIADQLREYGFRNIQSIESSIRFHEVEISITDGRHGVGEVEEKMGKVNGVVFTYQNDSIYIAGDTIWCDEVKIAIEKYNPQHIVVAGGAATFSVGDSVTMNTADIKETAAYTPDSKIWITHLESISPCKEDRKEITEYLERENLQFQCSVLADGESIELDKL